MKVKDLINKLKKHDGEAVVEVSFTFSLMNDDTEVRLYAIEDIDCYDEDDQVLIILGKCML
jgi:hypothetical protein